MKVLSLSLAKSILDKNSSDARRMVEYGELFEKYFIIVPSKKRTRINLSEKVVVYGTGCFIKPTQLIMMLLLARGNIKKEKVDVITAQDPFEIGKVGWLARFLNEVKLNVQLHGDFFSNGYWRRESLRNAIRYYLGLFIIKRADSIRVVSERIKADLVKRGTREDEIVEVAVYTSEQAIGNRQQGRDIYQGKFVFLSVARFSPEKNLGMLIKAFAKVSEEIRDAVLVLVGDGQEKEKLVQLTKDLKITDKVFFPGWVDDLSDYYTSSDVFVLSSNYEGWGRVIIEAAQAKLPIIMTDVGCAGEVIRDKESGLVVPVGREEALVKAMKDMYNDETLRNRLAVNALAAIEKLPNKEETLELYKDSLIKVV